MDGSQPRNGIQDATSSNSGLMKRRDLLTGAGTLLAASSLALLPALQPQTAIAQQTAGGWRFRVFVCRVR
jgi:hypothetical protein